MDLNHLIAFIHRYQSGNVEITPLAGDASLRAYYRVQINNLAYVLMDSSREPESLRLFYYLTSALREYNLPVPEIFASDWNDGLLLLEDFGACELAGEIYQHPNIWLPRATQLLQQWQIATVDSALDVSEYSLQKILDEVGLFDQFFVGYIGNQSVRVDQEKLHNEYAIIALQFAKQPQTLVHLDYHSRNLLITEGNALGIIDFQDACWGPVTYDLISITRDCYCYYERELRLEIEEKYRAQNYPQLAVDQWRYYCDMSALQRHLKVLGLFVRLYGQQGKDRYIADLPIVWKYALEEVSNLKKYLPYLYDLLSLLDEVVPEKFLRL